MDGIQKNKLRNLKSVNLHLTRNCNYKCRFCFARFNQIETRLTKPQYKELIKRLALAGTEKITFVGGEPTLVKYLPDLVIYAKSLGMVTMVVTNGTKITGSYLDQFKNSLDWMGLSIESASEIVNKELGRGEGGHVKQTIHVTQLLRSKEIKLKINTVVTKKNWNEDMQDFIGTLAPDRWKIFQVLPISGENDDAADLLISKTEFEYFCRINNRPEMIVENNEAMIESYIMIDPEGRFFNNRGNKLNHGKSILEYGLLPTLFENNFNMGKFEARGGIYEWD